MGLMNIHAQFNEGQIVEPIQALHLHRDRGYPILTFGNRYLTISNESNDVNKLPDDLDPHQILHNLVPDGSYTAENEVQYYERHELIDG